MCFRMKLNAKEGARARTYPFIGTVVNVYEPRFPIGGQRPLAYGIAMILAGHVATPGKQGLKRLIPAAMAVRQLVRIGASGGRQYLIAKAEAQDRFCGPA